LNKKVLLIMLILFAFTSACDALADNPATAIPTSATPTSSPPVCQQLQVVYIKAGTAFLWPDNGSGGQIGTPGQVTQVKISPGCQWVAYLQKDGQLFLKGINPIIPIALVVSKDYLDALANEGGQILQFEFSPDGQTLYFLVAYGEDYSGLDLFKVEMSTKVPVRLIGPGLGGNYTISPDSSCITIARATELDLYCKGDSQSQRIFGFSNECSIGTHIGLDVQWAKDSKSFSVVTPECYGGSDNDHLVFQQVPLARIGDIVAGTYVPAVYNFPGKPSDLVDIAPDGNCLIHQEDNLDLRNLHVVCKAVSATHFTDNAYISYPKNELEFFGWSPDAQFFVIGMPFTNPTNNAPGQKVYFTSPTGMAQPLLSEQVSATADTSVRVKDIRWVTNNLFLFTYNDGLYEEQFQKGGQVTPMSKIDGGPIDHDTAVNYEYDFAAPTQP
jgi:hypothetical protein